MEPCSQCIMQAMCINKRWQDIVDNCELICDYICDKAEAKEIPDPPHAGHMIYIKSLNRTFTVTVAGDKKNLFAIGDLWKSTTDRRSGYVEGDWDEVRLVTRDKPLPTMLMKKYERTRDGESDDKGDEE